MTVRVVLIDDEALARAGVRSVLAAAAPDIDVVAEAADGRAGVEAVLAHNPDVVLLDIRMPVLDGIATATELRRVGASVAVLVLTTFGEADLVNRALSAGVDGFVTKSSAPQELALAIRAVADGGAYLSPRVARMVLDGRVAPRHGTAIAESSELIARLTPRERDVLDLLARGQSNAEIGAALHLAEGTVKAHVTSLLRTLEVRNRVEAALIAYRAGRADGHGHLAP
jgi:DNA-binding NarL/FixJ family response regulator